MPDDRTLKIGDVAKLAELSIDAIGFYEREGLLGRVARSVAGQRLYDVDVVRRLGFVRRATALERLITKCSSACAPNGCAFLDEFAQPFVAVNADAVAVVRSERRCPSRSRRARS